MMKDFSSDHRKLRRKELTHSVTVFSRMARPMMSTSTSLHSRRLHLPSSIRKQGRSKLLVGGRGQKTTNRGLNRAYKGSTRNAGSTFKILAVYAPALDSADLTLATTEVDEEYYYTTTWNIISS